MAADKAKLKNVLCKYSTIQELLAPEDRLLLEEEDILAGNFPWSALTGTYMKRSAALSAVVISFHYHMCNRLSEWKNEVGDGGS